MSFKNVNEKRMKRIRKLFGFRTDVELAEFLGAQQPQISRWRNSGFHESTTKLIDELLKIISRHQREINNQKKQRKALEELLRSKKISTPDNQELKPQD